MVDYVKKFFDFIQGQNVYRASKLTFKKIFPETSFVYLSQSLLSGSGKCTLVDPQKDLLGKS